MWRGEQAEVSAMAKSPDGITFAIG